MIFRDPLPSRIGAEQQNSKRKSQIHSKMKVKFGKNPVAQQETGDPENVVTMPGSEVEVKGPETALTVIPHQPPAAPTLLLGDRLPEISDIQFPRINIVQKVGELSNAFPHGSIVFQRQLVLFELSIKNGQGQVVAAGTPPLDVVVLGFKPKRYQEKVEWGSEERAVTVDSEEAVRANGGTISWQEWELKKDQGLRLFTPMVDVLLGIKKPSHVNDANGVTFSYQVGADNYALALWTLKGTAYTGAAKPWFTARAAGCLRKGYSAFTWNLATILKNFGKNFAYIPVVTPKSPSSPEMLEFVRIALSME